MYKYRYLNSSDGIKAYASKDPFKHWTDQEAPLSSQERKEEAILNMSDTEYDEFLKRRRA